MIPLVFIDVETTGLDWKNYSVIQLSGIIKIGEEEEAFDYRIRPYKREQITEIASSKTGLTQEEIMQYPPVSEAYNSFINLLHKWGIGNTYNDKAYFIGYNSSFDMEFLRSFFEFNGDTRFGYYFWWPDIDVARLIAMQNIGRRQCFRSFKLADVYKAIFHEKLEGSHNSANDILATKRLFEYSARELLHLS